MNFNPGNNAMRAPLDPQLAEQMNDRLWAPRMRMQQITKDMEPGIADEQQRALQTLPPTQALPHGSGYYRAKLWKYLPHIEYFVVPWVAHPDPATGKSYHSVILSINQVKQPCTAGFDSNDALERAAYLACKDIPGLLSNDDLLPEHKR